MGLIHIYCGDGKGKTTAALGLALRAAGSGMKVHIVQLLKSSQTCELKSLALIPDISVARSDEKFGFTFGMSESDRQKLISIHNKLLLDAEEMMNGNQIDMLIIDEFNAAYELEMLDRKIAERIVFEKPEKVELILTGRNPARKFIDIADYVSEICGKKHPFDAGIKARKGIEY